MLSVCLCTQRPRIGLRVVDEAEAVGCLKVFSQTDESWDMRALTHLRMSTDRHRNPVFLVTDCDCVSYDGRDDVGK